MLTRLKIRDFKRFDEVSIELGNPVVFVGPNNSGKTTALQALAIWELGLRKWLERRGEGSSARERYGVTINRRDVLAAPVPDARLLWRNRRTHSGQQSEGGARKTRPRYFDIEVEGVTGAEPWSFALQFYYHNEESIGCRPVDHVPNLAVPAGARDVRVAMLPPMSGLASNEARIDAGAVQVRIGEGRTAEVLRNLCYRACQEHPVAWGKLQEQIQHLFGVTLDEPQYLSERGEIAMTYHEREVDELDLSSSGRGLQQTLLLLSYMAVNPNSVILLDEPDAHLEVLRQRQIYQTLTEAARSTHVQVIAASHSEVLLNEAADRDVVVAFVGRPHRIDDRGSQVAKALREVGFDQYYAAEQAGWALYLEGSTDLAILRMLAKCLGHEPAMLALERPFVTYVANQPSKASSHFFALREGRPGLVGYALYDRLDKPLSDSEPLRHYQWKRREIENYIATKQALLAWSRGQAETQAGGPIFSEQWTDTMVSCIKKLESALITLRRPSPWTPESKITDDFLDPLFADFYSSLDLPNLMRKTDYHELARYVPIEEIDSEVTEVLGAIASTAANASPYSIEAE